MERVEGKFGVFGCVILAGIIGTIGYAVVKISFYQSPIITIAVKAPPPPTIIVADVHTELTHSESQREVLPPNTSSPQVTTAPSSAPANNWNQAAGPKGGPFGPIFAVEAVQTFSQLKPCRLKVTYANDKENFVDSLLWILTNGAGCSLEPATTLRDIDEPKLQPMAVPGITVHWNRELQPGGLKVAHFLDADGLNVYTSAVLPAQSPPELIWIDIGPGDPWKD